MSALTIVLLMLILVVGSGRPIAVEKSSLPDRVNFVNVSVGENEERDFATTTKTRLRQSLEHLLSKMVERIIRRSRTRERKRPPDVPNYYGKNIATGDAGEGLSRDLLKVSETLLPTVRRFGRSQIDRRNGSHSAMRSRVKRENGPQDEAKNTAPWMKKDFTGHENNMRMHAFVVKDEDIPPCCSPAKTSTNRRYFMCSGAVLTLKHAITSASCIHYADVYESNVEADLAILVGATEPRAYVIKINRYEMHPDYEYDVDSKNYATNNLAILFLACSIVAQDIVVPHLPKGLNDDVAHMCCREGCDLITIMESPDNLHTARIVPAKHLPAPRHDDEDAPSYRQLSNDALETIQAINKPIFANRSLAPTRRARSPARLAAAPTFFGKQSRNYSSRPSSSTRPSSSKKRKKVVSSGMKNQQRSGKRKKPLKGFDDFVGRRSGRAHIPIMRALEAQGVNVEEELAAIDWKKVENSVGKKFSSNNREKLELFAKNVIDETMRRLENVLDDDDAGAGGTGDGSGGNAFEKLMPNNSPNKTIENFVHVFTKVVSSILPPNEGGSSYGGGSEEVSLEEKDLTDPPSSNQDCPPLGTPIFANEMLVGLLAYTCDDVQSWVEWKYVNIAKNLNWIRKGMTTEHGAVGLCAGSEKPVQARRKLPEDAASKLPARETETEIRGGKAVDWNKRREADEARRSVVAQAAGNLDRARNPPTAAAYPRIPKDPWFAKNSPLAPRGLRDDERQRIFADSRNQPLSPARHAPLYNVNTCYVKPDGSTDCQSTGVPNLR